MENNIDLFSSGLQIQMQKRRLHAIWHSCILILILILVIILNFVWYDSSKSSLFMSVTIITVLLVGWVIIYQLLEIILPLSRQLTVFDKISSAKYRQKTATIIQFDHTLYTVQGLLCNKLTVKENEKTKVYYLYNPPKDMEFMANTKITFATYDLLITSYLVGDQQ